MDVRDLSGGPPLLARFVASLRALPPLVQDTALATVLTGTLLIDLARSDVPAGGPVRAPDALGYVLVAFLMLPLALRRRYPRAVFAVILVDATVTTLLFYRPTSFGFGLIVATYTVARWCPLRVSVVAFVLAQAFGFFVKLRVSAAGVDVGWFNWPLDVTYFGAAWFLGYSIRTQHEYASALEHSREALARQAVQEERARIARELHDAVGHSVSVMLIQAGAAEKVLNRNPAKAEGALRSVGEVGRAALGEMDHLLGLLRDDDLEPEILRPSLANLDGLVTEFEKLGLDIELRIVGEPVPVPTALDQSAFRIVQEALTNTLKHAGPTRTELTLTFADGDLSIDIRDHGRRRGDHPPVGSVDHDSRGIVGMRERATMLRGDLAVGPCVDEGFRVSARLPIGQGPS